MPLAQVQRGARAEREALSRYGVMKMRSRCALCFALWAALSGCSDNDRSPPDVQFELPPNELPPVALPTRIGFGSCSDPNFPMETLDVASDLDPDLYIWLGDNVYADTFDTQVMRSEYATLAGADEFLRLRDRAHLLATWDDHDYGANDAGKDYSMKDESMAIFLEFWEEPTDSPRWDRDGIYTSYLYQDAGQALQIILLDTRFNRDAHTPNDGSGKNDYIPNVDDELTILGETQWAWLEQQFLIDADLRLVGSSIQFAHEYNGYESWTLFPNERERFIDLVESTQANGVMVLSGDVHWGEVSRLPLAGGYDLYDFTSSGINRDWSFVADNANRVAGPVPEFNVGMLDIDWSEATVTTSMYDATGAQRIELSLSFDDVSF